ncbi:FAD/NAD(P)-binding protein [Streptomyces sp. NPDC057136]|uniref:FAD/NAD(P)-binding protein n=1 Tax=Streptomyces sp. NPDC057136 TaxID=3346029 RepID=UPI003631B365
MIGGEPNYRVAVIGAGAAGAITAARLLEAATTHGLPLEIGLIDPAETTGRGIAYSTPDERHLLNVPAGRMSASPDDPDDFVRWLREHAGHLADPGRFVPRRLFGAYLADHLADRSARGPGRLVRLRDRVVVATRADRRLALRLASGSTATVDAAVLATGNHPPCADWAPAALRESDVFIADPWAPGALDRVPHDADVLLVGTGLTMVDVAMSLDRPGRTLHAVSRSGLLPQPHAAAPAPVAPPDLTGCTGLDELRGAVLRHVARTRRHHGDWRPALDGLRPMTAALWQGLPEHDRARFLRADARVWDVHRHRMPPVTAARVTDAREAGRLTVGAGEVAGAVLTGGGPQITLTDGRRLAVGAVVNCTGPQADPRRTSDPLAAALFTAGLAVPGPLGLGLHTGPDGRVSTAPGTPDAPLWTLGATRRGSLWESTAIPEIRTQAAEVAAAVVATLTAAPRPRPGSRRTPTDHHGLRLSTTPEAAAAYNEGLDRILRVASGVEGPIAEAVRLDPEFAVGHAALALLGHEWGAQVNVPAALAAAAGGLGRGADERERSFVAAVAARVDGTPAEGDTALLRHIEDHPRDAFAVSLAVPTIAFGGVTCGEQTWQLVEGLAPAYGDDWWYLGQLAFVRQEQERWDEAEALAARALAAVPSSGHAVHARAHVFYETGQHTEGLAWLNEWIRVEGPRANNRAHFCWHAALHELMTGQADAVRSRYLDQLAPPTVTGARALVDSGALLWRCRMTRSWEGPQPADEVLAHAPEGWLAEPPTAFAALHCALSLAAAEDPAGLARLRGTAARHALPVFREVVAPLCTALTSVLDRSWASALPILQNLGPRLGALGGSAAQRDVIEETLLFTLTSAGHHAEAAALLEARLERRPAPLDRTRLVGLRPTGV